MHASRIDAIADSLTDELVALRRTIHANPELAFEEHETARLVAERLTRAGIAVRTGVGKTGVVGLLEGGKSGPTVAIRADMDALPIHEETGLAFASTKAGRSHACGHDVHTVIGLGVAATLAQLRADLPANFPGRVKFLFQPAEETLQGARAMIADGALADPKPEIILGYHNWPQLPAGTVGFHPDVVMASSDAFDVTLRGSAGHGAHPHLAIDTIAGAAQFVTQVQTIVSREIAPSSAAVVSIGQIAGGTARNVIAASVELKGGVRTVEPGIAEKVEAAMRRMLDGIKTGMRLDYTLDWKRLAPVLRNDPAVLARYVAVARDTLGADKVVQMPAPSMGSEDFACLAELIPAAHLRIGSKIDGLDTAIHRANYDCNDVAITTGVRVVARAVADLLARPPA